MKTKIRCYSYILMATLLTSTMYAQTVGKEQVQNVVQKNLSAENVKKIAYYPRTISWWDSGNGFICRVSDENMDYMTRYDKQGKYVETLTKKEWNDSSALQPAFQQSKYKLQKVTAYWEVTDARKKGYYLEMNDHQNHSSGMWVDDQGKFSIIPLTKTKQ